jgi:GTP pyrophosphokinase
LQGEEMVKKFLAQKEVEYNTSTIEKLCKIHNYKQRDDFYLAIVDKKVVLSDADADLLHGKKAAKIGWFNFIPFMNSGTPTPNIVSAPNASLSTQEFVSKINRKHTLEINEDTLQHCTFPDCCHPIPGDDVLGYITQDGRLEIHKRQCETATKLKTRYGNNIIACQWNMHQDKYFNTRIRVRGVDARGVLHSIADCFESLQNLIVKEITLKTHDGIFEGSIVVSVYNTENVQLVCNELIKIENVTKAVRED